MSWACCQVRFYAVRSKLVNNCESALYSLRSISLIVNLWGPWILLWLWWKPRIFYAGKIHRWTHHCHRQPQDFAYDFRGFGDLSQMALSTIGPSFWPPVYRNRKHYYFNYRQESVKKHRMFLSLTSSLSKINQLKKISSAGKNRKQQQQRRARYGPSTGSCLLNFLFLLFLGYLITCQFFHCLLLLQ